MEQLLTVDKDAWKKEADEIKEFYQKINDGKLPKELLEQLDKLNKSLQTKKGK